MGQYRQTLIDKRATLEAARAAHLRAETAWLDAVDCDADDYSHPLRVALDAAQEALEAAQESFDGAQAALAISEELRVYMFRGIDVGAQGRLRNVVRWQTQASSMGEAERHARAWIGVQGGPARSFVVAIECEDGDYSTVEGTSPGAAGDEKEGVMHVQRVGEYELCERNRRLTLRRGATVVWIVEVPWWRWELRAEPAEGGGAMLVHRDDGWSVVVPPGIDVAAWQAWGEAFDEAAEAARKVQAGGAS